MTLREALAQHELLISDGGIGTQLQQLGLQPGECGDAWNIVHPNRVATVHSTYVEAGSQVITTNTFGANRFVLAKYKLEAQQARIARAGARIAKEVVADRGWVMGSVGPCGALLQPLGDVNPAELEESLRVQIGALLEGGADAILIETMTALDELRLSVRVAKEMNAPFIIASCAFDPARNGPRTLMGATPEECVHVAKGVDAIGANCGRLATVEQFVDLCSRLRTMTALPLIIQPNGGQPVLEGDKIVYRVSPEDMAERLAAIAACAQIVGGCCGTAPAHIRAFKERIVQGRGVSN